MSETIAEPTLAEALASTSDEALLNTFASLTHQIHGIADEIYGPREVASLRERRLVVQTEILSRMAARR